jgi:AmiR/NasT family two-component response regulator
VDVMRSLVLIADDVAVAQRIRIALRYAVALRLDATLDARAAVREEIVRLAPDVVLVADACQRVNTIRRLLEVRGAAPAATVLLLSSPAGGSTEDAFRCGADGILAAGTEAPGLGMVLGQIGLGHLQLARRPEPDLPAVDREVPPLRVVTGQDARGTRSNA